MKPVAILGAGIAGLSSGWLLKQKGIDFVILEKQSFPGGLARSFEWNDFSCDFAAHRLFTTDETVLQQLLRLVPMGRHIRRSRIYLKGHWLRDPLEVLQLVSSLSLSEGMQIVWTYMFRSRNLPEDNFENYVLSRYGRSLYKLFFQPYTEKLFGIPGDEISVLWARQKVRLANPLDNLRENTKNKFQYFYYPVRGGYGSIVENLYAQIKDHIIFNTQVVGLDVVDDQITQIRYLLDGDSKSQPVNYVISTLPITITGRMIGAAFQLNFQKVDAVYLLINRPLVSDNHWFYFTDGDIAINRMVEFKNMSVVDTPPQKTVICSEVTQNHADVIGKVINDLNHTGLITKTEILDAKVIREPFAYPVYDNKYDLALSEAKKVFSRYSNLFLVGRNAEFQHREVDDNFTSAIETVNKITNFLRLESIPIETPAPMQTEPLQPMVYVVILTFNHYEMTYDCLKSVLAIEYPSLRIVLVDNGSDDGTPEHVRQDFPQVMVIENNQNLGVPAGYNVGIKWALDSGSDYILMLNNDTVLEPDLLDKLLEQARLDPKTGIVMPMILYYGTRDKIWSRGGRYRRFPPAILFDDRRIKSDHKKVRLIEYAPSCALLIHRQAFELAGLFDPGYFFNFDDWDFSERVRAYGLHIWFVSDAVIWHRVSVTTQGPDSPLFWYTTGASMARYYRRHGKPAWISLPVHIGYYILREFFWKQNWRNWKDYQRGLRDGLQKPLGPLPQFK